MIGVEDERNNESTVSHQSCERRWENPWSSCSRSDTLNLTTNALLHLNPTSTVLLLSVIFAKLKRSYLVYWLQIEIIHLLSICHIIYLYYMYNLTNALCRFSYLITHKIAFYDLSAALYLGHSSHADCSHIFDRNLNPAVTVELVCTFFFIANRCNWHMNILRMACLSPLLSLKLYH